VVFGLILITVIVIMIVMAKNHNQAAMANSLGNLERQNSFFRKRISLHDKLFWRGEAIPMEEIDFNAPPPGALGPAVGGGLVTFGPVVTTAVATVATSTAPLYSRPSVSHKPPVSRKPPTVMTIVKTSSPPVVTATSSQVTKVVPAVAGPVMATGQASGSGGPPAVVQQFLVNRKHFKHFCFLCFFI